ncbi:MAG: transposase [Deltaproteobacteria bacterium]|nr:transposase [Deltaproteobacteria bacterium]
MELLDALCSMPNARSVVELSLSPHFRHQYQSIYKAIAGAGWENINLPKLAGPYLSKPKEKGYWLFGVDGTPQKRQFAYTLSDRGYVYYPNPVGSNKPITIGHEYSTVALLPELGPQMAKSWVVPLSTRRASTDDDKELVGAEQINALLDDSELPWHGELVVNVGDSRYSKPAYLHAVHQDRAELVTIAKVRSNRTLYHYLAPPDEKPTHRPAFKGKTFKLHDPNTHTPPDKTLVLELKKQKKGREHTALIEVWEDMTMPGKNKPERIPMENYPFRLVRITCFDKDGYEVIANPWWLIVVGERRRELSLEDIHHCYTSRSRLEHFFRFGKQKLLLNAFQTAETEREENWWRIVHLAYLMLWMAQPLTQHLPRPWEQHLPEHKRKIIGPAIVQRDFSRLISQFGSPARKLKPRGKSPGRKKGFRLPPRERHPVVYKGPKQPDTS